MLSPHWILRSWQLECLENWLENGGRGVAHVATGSGKTLLALAAMYALQMRPELGGDSEPLVRIVVPKVFLAVQWLEALHRELGIPWRDISLCYGGAAPSQKTYMIYVINSARWRLARQVLRELSAGARVFLICDECHHCISEANQRIFDFVPHVLKLPGRYFALGLSATPGSLTERTALTAALGPEIYRYGADDAVRDGIMAKCRMVNIGVERNAR